ncbi:hypothetical protein GF359_04585, partial [candidate division WOR-3 bacterium]|nr:hypothetical protein [candidate division WOR-3 bacterium]MBD3364471.1 hypothetical protein [candidate division WOR-3 bacterium]
MRKRYTAVLLFFALILPGCGNKTPNEDITAVSVTEKLDADVLNKLKRHGISDEFVSLSFLSPDSDYWVFSLDSIVRFGPEDVLWLEEWPDEWFGLRSRGILFLYDPNADTLMMMAECEEVVNLYY